MVSPLSKSTLGAYKTVYCSKPSFIIWKDPTSKTGYIKTMLYKSKIAETTNLGSTKLTQSNPLTYLE